MYAIYVQLSLWRNLLYLRPQFVKAKNRNCLHVADSPITFLGLLAAIILILFQMSELLVMEGTNALKLKAVSVL